MNKQRMNRRRVLASAALGAGILATGGSAAAARAAGQPTRGQYGIGGQWISWDDGYLYPITMIDELGRWIISDDEADPRTARYIVESAGWVEDSQVWYRVHSTDAEGVWYDGDDGYVYLTALG